MLNWRDNAANVASFRRCADNSSFGIPGSGGNDSMAAISTESSGDVRGVRTARSFVHFSAAVSPRAKPAACSNCAMNGASGVSRRCDRQK